MALHMQQQVLDAVVAVLQAASTDAAARVYADRLDNLQKAKLPAILVDEADAGESIEPGTITTVQQRTLAVQIRCVLALTDDNAAEARAFGLQVEKAMFSDAARTALSALCSRWAITASRLEQSTEGDRPYAQRVQDWTFSYSTRRATPDVKA